uniref:C-type lectin domain-containing protein n=1 Tax=Latimeria chalumnae TaxID=7897 RepID=H3A7I9_LATCH
MIKMDMFFTLLLISAVASVISPRVILQYHFVELEKTWGEAQNYCRAHYQDLISIHSAQQMETIRSISGVNNEEAVWIGLRNTWLWSSGDPVNFTNWNPGQPNNAHGSQHCAAILSNSSRWHDTSCTENRSFVCFSARRQYHFIQEKKTWFEALEICRKNYTDLVSVHSQKELEEIKNISGITAIWIGLYRNVWHWSNGDPAPFQNWNTGEPDNVGNDENCVGMWIRNPSAGKWKDSRCREETYFLCSQVKYILVKENKTWIEAFNYCRTNHTDLASIPNATAQTEIAELAKTSSGGGGVWIGLRRDRLLGFWFWMDDDESEFSNWGDGSKGDPFSDHCGMIDKEENFTWRFECCSTKLNFICYKV